MSINVDLVANGKGQGEVAGRFIGEGINVHMMKPWIGKDHRAYFTVFTGGDAKKAENYKTVPAMNANATLRRDEWKTLDEAVLKIAEQRLGGIEDLRSAGLTYNLGNAMGTTVLEWHDVGDAMEADTTMDGVSRSKGDRPTFQYNYLPIPIIHVDYEINARVLEASRKLGNPLDTTSVERATRRIQEKLEDMLFTDTSYSFGTKDERNRNTIYSYVNHPDREAVLLSDHGAWDDSTTGGGAIIKSVLDMKQAAINANYFGPYQLYIPAAYETVLDEDYDSTTHGTTIRERIEKISGINSVKVADRLAADNVLLVQMTTDVVRLVNGMGIQNVQWSTEGNFINKYKVMTIQVPQIRSDQNGKTGIVHMA